MKRTACLAAMTLLVAVGATSAQFGGMGGMGGGMGNMMGGGFGGVSVRRAVQVEMEGGRRISGQIELATIGVQSDLGHHAIHPNKIKLIRFLKPTSEPNAEPDNGDAQPPGNNAVDARAMRRQMQRQMQMQGAMMKMAAVDQNEPVARAKVILYSGEEIVGNLANSMGYHISVDYGSITPTIDKLRTLTFSDAPPRAEPAEGSPRAAGDARDLSSATPHYFRHAQALAVRSPAGDRVVLYNMDTKQSLELSAPKDAPLEVTPIYGPDLMALTLRGTRVARIAVADNVTGWHVQDLNPPAEGRVMPIVAQGVAVYSVGRHVYAFSAAAHRWDVAELSEDLRATPVVGPNSATIEGGGHIYTFVARTGKWEHIDVRAILDVARAERK